MQNLHGASPVYNVGRCLHLGRKIEGLTSWKQSNKSCIDRMKEAITHLAVGVEAVRHVLIFVELSCRLGLLAPAAFLGSGSPLLQGWEPLPSVGSVMREASLAIVVKSIPIGLVSIEICGCLVGPTSSTDLPLYSRILQAENDTFDTAFHVAIEKSAIPMQRPAS